MTHDEAIKKLSKIRKLSQCDAEFLYMSKVGCNFARFYLSAKWAEEAFVCTSRSEIRLVFFKNGNCHAHFLHPLKVVCCQQIEVEKIPRYFIDLILHRTLFNYEHTYLNKIFVKYLPDSVIAENKLLALGNL